MRPAAVGPAAQGVLFTLVDHPAVAPGTIEKLLAGAGPLLRIPCYQSHHGHPIWFSRELIAELIAVREPGTAKDVIHAHRAETLFLDVDDPGVVADIDDPTAYHKLTGAVL